MDKLKRYDMTATTCPDVYAVNVVNDDDNIFPASHPLEWCKSSDVALLEAENERLKAENEKLKQQLEDEYYESMAQASRNDC